MTSVEGPQLKLAYSRPVTAAFSMEINGIHSKAVPTGPLDQIRKRLSSLGTRAGVQQKSGLPTCYDNDYPWNWSRTAEGSWSTELTESGILYRNSDPLTSIHSFVPNHKLSAVLVLLNSV